MPRIEGAVDLLLFNPPYVVTSDDEERLEQSRAGLGGALAGGVHGTQLVDAMIRNGIIERVLSPGGRFYLVAIRANDPPALVAALQARGLHAEVSAFSDIRLSYNAAHIVNISSFFEQYDLIYKSHSLAQSSSGIARRLSSKGVSPNGQASQGKAYNRKRFRVSRRIAVSMLPDLSASKAGTDNVISRGVTGGGATGFLVR